MSSVKLWIKIILYMFLFLILEGLLLIPFVLIELIIAWIGYPSYLTFLEDPSSGTLTNSFIIINAFVMLGSAYVATLLFRKLVDKKSFDSLGFPFKKFKMDFMHGCLIGIIMVSVGFIMLYVFL